MSVNDIEELKKKYLSAFPDASYHPAIHAIHKWLNEHGYTYAINEVADSIHRVMSLLPAPYDAQLKFSPQLLEKFFEDDKKKIGYAEIRERINRYFRDALEKDSENIFSRTQFYSLEHEPDSLDLTSLKDWHISMKDIYSLTAALHRQK